MTFYKEKVNQRVDRLADDYTKWINSFGSHCYELSEFQIKFLFDALENIASFAKADKETPLDQYDSLTMFINLVPKIKHKKINMYNGLPLDDYLTLKLLDFTFKYDMMETFWLMYNDACDYIKEVIYPELTPELQTAASIMG